MFIFKIALEGRFLGKGQSMEELVRGFYLFTPVYYADVTDIWRLPSGQRIIVNLAGVYFEFLFCSFLCLLSLLLRNTLSRCNGIYRFSSFTL